MSGSGPALFSNRPLEWDASLETPLARTLSGLTIVGNLGGLYGAAWAWEVVAADLFWPMLVPMGVLMALTPVMAAQASRGLNMEQVERLADLVRSRRLTPTKPNGPAPLSDDQGSKMTLFGRCRP